MSRPLAYNVQCAGALASRSQMFHTDVIMYEALQAVVWRETPSGENFGILAFADHSHAHNPT